MPSAPQFRHLLLAFLVLPSLLAWGQQPAKFMDVCSKKHPYSMGPCATPPKLIHAIDPQYPEKARQARYEGTVILWLIVETDGQGHDIRVAKSLGMGLDLAAVNAVKEWKFEPATYEGKAVPVEINVEVNFRLTRRASAEKELR